MKLSRLLEVMGCAAAFVGAACVADDVSVGDARSASATTDPVRPHTPGPRYVPYEKVQTAGATVVGVRNLATGETRLGAGGIHTRNGETVFTNMYLNYSLEWNLTWVGPPPQHLVICDPNDPANPRWGYIADGISSSNCADPNEWPATDDLDIRWDNYRVGWWWDPNTGIDPNGTTYLDAVHVLIGRGDSTGFGPQTFAVIVGFFERFDRDGDGILGTSTHDGPYLAVVTVPSAGLWRVDIPLYAWPRAHGIDLFMLDLEDQLYDPVTMLPNGQPSCGYFTPRAGGLLAVGTDTNGDPNTCPSPDDLVWLGSVTDPRLGTDFWMASNGFADAGGNIPVDPNTDGEPGLSYADILNGGYVVNPMQTTPGGTQLSNSFNFAVDIPFIDWCICGSGGTNADIDGNCHVDLTDLGILLANYGTGERQDDGDANFDGKVDLTDLGIVLGEYGNDCF